MASLAVPVVEPGPQTYVPTDAKAQNVGLFDKNLAGGGGKFSDEPMQFRSLTKEGRINPGEIEADGRGAGGLCR